MIVALSSATAPENLSRNSLYQSIPITRGKDVESSRHGEEVELGGDAANDIAYDASPRIRGSCLFFRGYHILKLRSC